MNRFTGLVFTCVISFTLPAFAQHLENKSPEYTQEKIRITKRLNRETQSANTQIAAIKTSVVLQSLAIIGDSMIDAHYGNLEYWFRTAQDYARTAKGLGHGIHILAEKISSAPIRAALNNTANDLEMINAGSSGDVNYWMQRVMDIRHQVTQACDQLYILSSQLANETIDHHTSLRAFVAVLTSVDHQGSGDADYWMRATVNLVKLGRASGKALNQLNNSISDPLYSVLNTYIDRLNKLSSAGRGDADYWLSRAKTTAIEVDKIGVAILEVSKNA